MSVKDLIEKLKKDLNKNQDSSYITWQIEKIINQLTEAYTKDIEEINKRIDDRIKEAEENRIHGSEPGSDDWLRACEQCVTWKKAKQIVNEVLK